LISVPPEFFLSREEELKRYNLHQNNLENKGYVKMFQEKIDVINKACPQTKTVLDYGCGRDMVLKTLLAEHGYEVDGYDPNFLPDQNIRPTYDLIISTETFEHFKSPREEIDKISTLLAHSGHLAIMTRFYGEAGTSPDPEKFCAWYYRKDPTHIAFYHPDTFDWLARYLKCQIVFKDQKDFVVLQLDSSKEYKIHKLH
jgi:SAM-dependent methyltransferase